jgi:BON domain
VKNGNVTLTGVVNNSLERIVAEKAVRFAATYFSLDNQLRVENEITKEATD